jgi:hypothetical protein
MAARDFEICIDAMAPERLDIQAEPGEHEHLVAKLVALGGTVLAEHPRFTTLADPEGNELCVNRH